MHRSHAFVTVGIGLCAVVATGCLSSIQQIVPSDNYCHTVDLLRLMGRLEAPVKPEAEADLLQCTEAMHS